MFERQRRNCKIIISLANRLLLTIFVATMIFCFLGESNTHAESIYVDLGTIAGIPSSAYGGPSGVAGTWNGVGIGTTSSLNDITGATTSVDVTVTAYGIGTGGGSTTDPDYTALFADTIYSEDYWSVDFSGLADGPYNVYLCAPDSTSVYTGVMNVNGIEVPEIQSGFTVESTMVSGGALSISGTPPGIFFAGLAGVQVCAVPFPGAI